MKRAQALDGASGKPRSVAVIGAGWAGCAAAVELSRRGWRVTLVESARTLGGRARAVVFDGRKLDNGQHILLGAYTESLRLMRDVGVDVDAAVLRLPLQMRYPAGAGGMDFIAPKLPAPLHLLVALLRAGGLAREDKLALARFSSTARWMGWQLAEDCSVTELLERFDQTDRLVRLMWRPLCIAALNTPPERASARIFLNVLRDSLGKRRNASDMLLPRVDLGALFPDAAAAYVRRAGGTVVTGHAVGGLYRTADGWSLRQKAGPAGPAPAGAGDGAFGADDTARGATGLHADALPARFDAVVLATPSWESVRLLAGLQPSAEPDAGNATFASASGSVPFPFSPPVLQSVSPSVSPSVLPSVMPPAPSDLDMPEEDFEPQQSDATPQAPPDLSMAQEPISTCYLQYAQDVRLPHAFLALVDDPANAQWGQFVFDRGQLNAGQAGLLAVVVSASTEAIAAGKEALTDAVVRQLVAQLKMPVLAQPSWSRLITEKRATFACTPGLRRPVNATGFAGLVLAGDYTDGDYPATIESAVRSGVAAAALLAS